MTKPGARRWTEIVEHLYTVAVIFGLTLGPLYQIRVRHFGVLKADFLDDPMVQLTFASAYAVAAGLLARRWITWWGRRAVIVLAGLFTSAVFVSTAWSLERNRTFVQGVMLAGTTVFALYLADRYDDGQIAVLVFGAMQIGATISTIVLVREWSGARDPIGQWTGIYFNRNSLGPVAGLGLATGVLLAWKALVARRWPVVAGVAACMLMDLRLLYGSRSATSIGGLGVFLVVGAVAAVTTLVARRRGWEPGRALVVGAGPVVLVALAAVAARGAIFRALGKNDQLEGRIPLWKVVWRWIQIHPVRGSGFMSAWTREDYQEQVQNAVFSHEPTAHSGYLEVVLGTGFVGGAVLLALLAVMVTRALRSSWRNPGPAGVWRIAIVAYVLAVNLQESFIGPNLLVWALALAAAFAPVPAGRSPSPGGASATLTGRV